MNIPSDSLRRVDSPNIAFLRAGNGRNPNVENVPLDSSCADKGGGSSNESDDRETHDDVKESGGGLELGKWW